MMRAILAGMALWAAATTIAIGIAGWERGAFAGEEKSSTNTAEQIKIVRGRLPPYYGKVVTEEQRKKIFMIQEKYRPRIAAAKAQLEALVQEEKATISAVLSEQQKKQIEAARAAAYKKRAE